MTEIVALAALITLLSTSLALFVIAAILEDREQSGYNAND